MEPAPLDGLYFGTNAGGQWVTTRISTRVATAGLTLDPGTGRLHAVVRGRPNIYLTSADGRAWTFREMVAQVGGSGDSIRILGTIREAALPTSRLFVVELVLGAPNEGLADRILDLHMLVMPGGRERPEGEWRSLFERGGWQLADVRPTATRYRILVGTRA